MNSLPRNTRSLQRKPLYVHGDPAGQQASAAEIGYTQNLPQNHGGVSSRCLEENFAQVHNGYAKGIRPHSLCLTSFVSRFCGASQNTAQKHSHPEEQTTQFGRTTLLPAAAPRGTGTWLPLSGCVEGRCDPHSAGCGLAECELAWGPARCQQSKLAADTPRTSRLTRGTVSRQELLTG